MHLYTAGPVTVNHTWDFLPEKLAKENKPERQCLPIAIFCRGVKTTVSGPGIQRNQIYRWWASIKKMPYETKNLFQEIICPTFDRIYGLKWWTEKWLDEIVALNPSDDQWFSIPRVWFGVPKICVSVVNRHLSGGSEELVDEFHVWDHVLLIGDNSE